MGTPLGPKYIPYAHMDPLGLNTRWSWACLGPKLVPAFVAKIKRMLLVTPTSQVGALYKGHMILTGSS